MTREEKIAMIGMGNLKVWPWTITRTVATVVFLGLFGSLMALGIILGGVDNIVDSIVVCGLLIFFTLLISLGSYYWGEVQNLKVEVIEPGPIVKDFLELKAVLWKPVEQEVIVVGKDGKEHNIVPNKISYNRGEKKHCVLISGRLDSLFIELNLGKGHKKFIYLVE